MKGHVRASEGDEKGGQRGKIERRMVGTDATCRVEGLYLPERRWNARITCNDRVCGSSARVVRERNEKDEKRD